MMRAIREIELTDIPALFRVRSATDENCLSMEQLSELGINEASVREKLLGSYKGWLCEVDGETVGFAMGDKQTGEMWVIAVLPGHVCKGIGGELLTRMDAWLFGEGCKELWLTTDIDTTLRAYRFYKKHGWEDWKIEDGLRYMRCSGKNSIH